MKRGRCTVPSWSVQCARRRGGALQAFSVSITWRAPQADGRHLTECLLKVQAGSRGRRSVAPSVRPHGLLLQATSKKRFSARNGRARGHPRRHSTRQERHKHHKQLQPTASDPGSSPQASRNHASEGRSALTSQASAACPVPEFRSDPPQISLRNCADQAPKFRAHCAQISLQTQVINCVII